MIRVVLVLVFVAWSSFAFAQASALPLEVILPVPVGVSGAGKDADSRLYRAHTGIAYRVPGSAIGGTFPYTFSLINAPAGMTVRNAGDGETCGVGSEDLNLVEVQCGVIEWVNPTSTATNVQFCATDSATAPASSCKTWTVAVGACTPGAGGCCVIDGALGNNANAGTPAAPWATMAKAHASCGARSILYIRYAGGMEYGISDIAPIDTECGATAPGPGLRRFLESAQPVIWIGYPGDERPTINWGASGSTPTPCVRLSGENSWVEHLTLTNSFIQMFQFARTSQFGAVVWDNVFDTAGPGAADANPAFIMYVQNYPNQSYGDVIAFNTFTNINYGAGMASIKLYSTQKVLVYRNRIDNVTNRTAEREAQIAVKSDNTDYTVRANSVSGIPVQTYGIGGNQHMISDITQGEVSYNLVINPGGSTLLMNEDGQAGASQIFRNTLMGDVLVEDASSGDGPFTFTRNVIVNNGGSGGSCPQRLSCQGVTDFSRIVVSANLQGAEDGTIVDADGNLVEPSLSSDGPLSGEPKGHLMGDAEEPPLYRFRFRLAN